MKSKYIILIGLLLASNVSASALLSIGKALVIYSSKSAVVVKNAAPVVKVVPKLVPKVVPNAIIVKPIPQVIPPKITPKMISNSTKVNKETKVVPKSTVNKSVDDLPDIPNTSPLIIWNKIEDNRSKNTTK